MADHRRTGTTLGRFHLEEEIGAGAAGVVYRATDTLSGSTVALKVIHPELLGDVEVKERFKREILLSRRVQHPGVCRIFDLHEIEDGDAVVLALAMELLDGDTLASEIHEKGHLTPARTLEILEELVPALEAAHEAGVVHRDLKPGNVLVLRGAPPGASVKLLDFGMATADDVMRVTRPGNTVGSLRFIAPEVWEGLPAAPAADLYALGVLLFACLAGRLPYEASTPGEMFQALKKPPPSLVGDIEGVTPSMNAVVQKAMARRPNERQRSARQILEEFRRAVEGEQTLRVRESGLFLRSIGVPPPLKPIPAAAFFAGCAAVLGAALVLGWIITAVRAPAAPATSRAAQAAAAAGIAAEPPAPAAPAPLEAARDPAPPTELTPLPPPPLSRDRERGSRTARTEERAPARATEERAALQAALRKRGMQLEDLPQAQALEQRAREHEANGERAEAQAALKQARQIAETAPIDRGFIMSKQKRLIRMLERAPSRTRDKVRPMEADIARAFAARDYEKANSLLNRALAAAR